MPQYTIVDAIIDIIFVPPIAIALFGMLLMLLCPIWQIALVFFPRLPSGDIEMTKRAYRVRAFFRGTDGK